VQEFMALEADGVCVGLEAFLNSLDGSVEGVSVEGVADAIDEVVILVEDILDRNCYTDCDDDD